MREIRERLENISGDICGSVKGLEMLCEIVGYNEKGYYLGVSPIINFLADNPGAIEMISEFIIKYADAYDINEEILEELEYNREDD